MPGTIHSLIISYYYVRCYNVLCVHGFIYSSKQLCKMVIGPSFGLRKPRFHMVSARLSDSGLYTEGGRVCAHLLAPRASSLHQAKGHCSGPGTRLEVTKAWVIIRMAVELFIKIQQAVWVTG